jgi:hypothetical protein
MQSSGMLNRVALVLTDTVFLRSVLWLLVTINVVSILPIFVILMMEALRSSETSVHTRATRRNIPEDTILPVVIRWYQRGNNAVTVILPY